MTSHVEDLDALGLAERAWESALRRVDGVDLEGPSACTGWSRRDLINHVNGGGHRYLLLIARAPAAGVEATRGTDYAGDNPRAYFVAYEDPLRHQFSLPAQRDTVVQHRAGPVTLSTLLLMRTLDLTLHAWDLTESIPGSSRPITEELATYLLGEAAPVLDLLRRIGLYEPAYPPPPSSTASARLLSTSGRRRREGM